MMKKILYACFVIVLLCGAAACGAPTTLTAAPNIMVASASFAATIARYRQAIPEQMQKDNIPGLSIAVVDDQGILWEEGFGYTDWDRQTPVTPSTLFSIQSMSKSFTATAAMFAAQDGMVDLDAPITTYLPNFHVNSIFEEHPEQKMTLRILLSHTAGFAHEAPYGSNYDHPAVYSFENHIASISDTWLKFPVGTRYSYSNLGIDLAGYILQVRSGKPFIQYLQGKVLDPLGMKDTTLDVNRVRANPTRAIGHTGAPLRPPVDFLLIPSGGVWTTAADMTRYLQFHINKGAMDGTRLLREDLAETMYTPPNVPANLYAQGVIVTTRHGARHIEHGGGGFGFNSDMIWYPELKLGVVVLSNATTQDAYVAHLTEDVLDSIIDGNASLYAQRAASAVHIEPVYLPSREDTVLSDDNLKALIESKALPDEAAAQSRASAVAGKYILTGFGFPQETLEVIYTNGKLYYSYLGVISPLIEVKPGLYFSLAGDAFDVRGPSPMFTNIRMVKANPQVLPFRIAFYVICGLLFLSALLLLPTSLLIRGIDRKNGVEDKGTLRPPRSPWLAWVSGSAALASLFSLVCMAIFALAPDLVYLPWPRPFPELLWWQFALLNLPFASLLMGVGITLLAALAWRSRAWGKGIGWYYITVALALLSFNLMIL